MPFLCVDCNHEVRPRQHALECEECLQWQHRLCNTGVSLQDYRRLTRNEIELIFHCNSCTRVPEQTEEQTYLAIPAPQARADENAPVPDQSFNVTAEFDEDKPVIESDIEDPQLPDTIIAARPVTYEIVEQGSKQRFKKLVSSDGFAYTIKRASTTVTHWRCSVRNKSVWCKATVMQRGNQFAPGPNSHVHASDPGITKKTKIGAQALIDAAQHPIQVSR